MSISGYAQSQDLSKLCISDEERYLFEIINKHRVEKGLKEIPFSNALSLVAKKHCEDLDNNFNFMEYMDNKTKCNLHSWSAKGKWTPCCYTADHAKAQCMWDKPKEIAGYQGSGYEISFAYSGQVTANDAFNGWLDSPGHYAVMTNKNIWKDVKWEAMGIGIGKHYSVVWFGKLPDEYNKVQVCK